MERSDEEHAMLKEKGDGTLALGKQSSSEVMHFANSILPPGKLKEPVDLGARCFGSVATSSSVPHARQAEPT